VKRRASWEGLPSIEGHTVTLQLSDEDTIQYRWRCSCGSSGEAQERIKAARAGAVGHVAAMAARPRGIADDAVYDPGLSRLGDL
jgi:hypothetical protein